MQKVNVYAVAVASDDDSSNLLELLSQSRNSLEQLEHKSTGSSRVVTRSPATNLMIEKLPMLDADQRQHEITVTLIADTHLACGAFWTWR